MIISFSRQASPDEMAAEIDRRGEAIERLEKERDEAAGRVVTQGGMPPGWRAVPVEPTEEMTRRGTAAISHDGEPPADDPGDPNYAEDVRRILRAAIAAAPQPPAATGWKLVPVKDTEEMWGGLARQIVLWHAFSRHTGAALHQHLKAGGYAVPAWLEALIPNKDRVPPKGAVAGAIYRAMIDAAPSPESAKGIERLDGQSIGAAPETSP